MEKATFGAGCFWHVEAAFLEIGGVTSTAVGYSGGHLKDPTYRGVCTGQTGHAEVVQLEYDPTKVTYEELLEAFWKLHDPTTMNRQGPDVGTQYRSAIFYHTPSQEAAREFRVLNSSNQAGLSDPSSRKSPPPLSSIALRSITSGTSKRPDTDLAA